MLHVGQILYSFSREGQPQSKLFFWQGADASTMDVLKWRFQLAGMLSQIPSVPPSTAIYDFPLHTCKTVARQPRPTRAYSPFVTVDWSVRYPSRKCSCRMRRRRHSLV
jgi:hypothetical protein